MLKKLRHYSSVIGYTYRVNLLQFLEYPTGLIPLLSAWFLFNLGQYYMINIIITKFQPFPGWGQYEVAFLYGFSLLSESMSVMFFYSTFNISNFVINGWFDNLLIRPMSVYPQFLFKGINFVAISDLTSALIIIVYSLMKMPNILTFTMLLKSLAFLICATMLRVAIFTIVNSISFWTNKATSVHSICCFMTIRIPKFPLTILPKLLQSLLTFIIPIGFIAYFPVSNILSKNITENNLSGIVVIIFVSILLYLISIFTFQKGLKKYESAGS